jgi:DNA ligase-1
MTTLYKKDSKGKCRIINFWTEGDKFYQSAGIKDGQLVENIKVCKPKNISKSNATTREEQAILDMASKIREKLQEDYFETEKEAMNSTVVLPMLAKKFEDEEKKIDWSNCYIQPKLDGQRCLAICTKEGNVTLLSRDGVDIQKSHGSMQHIIDDLSTIKEDIILDGELYIHSTEDNFQDVMKAIKKYRSGVSELVKYYVYDKISSNPFKERTVRGYIKNLLSCVEVSTYNIYNKENLLKYHNMFLKEGYEGSIIRWGNEGYKINGRSSNLLKYKNFQDSDYLIVDVIPAENRPEWGMIVCQSKYGTFDATPKMNHDKKKEILLNKEEYIGQTAVIKHFGYTESGLPRFPIFLGIRNDNLIK